MQHRSQVKKKGQKQHGRKYHCIRIIHLSLSLSTGEEEICTFAQEYNCVKDAKGIVLYKNLVGMSTSIRILDYRSVTTIIGYNSPPPPIHPRDTFDESP